MRPASTARVSQLLVNWGQGDKNAREALIPLVYGELRRLARRRLGGERPDHTLESAALVNEAYLRLVRQDALQWQNRAHFFGVAAQVMRHWSTMPAIVAPESGRRRCPANPEYRNRFAPTAGIRSLGARRCPERTRRV